MMKSVAIALSGLLTMAAMQAPPPEKPAVPLSMWRLDCGRFALNDYGLFSDTMAYRSGPKELTVSCYLIRHGDRYMLWDTGLTDKFIGKPSTTPLGTISLERSIIAQLADIKVRPDQIGFVGASHYHYDHVGQAASFPKAKLLIGKEDLEAMKAVPAPDALEPALLAPWTKGGGKVEAATGDVDVFQDGSVIMLKTPGHTPGHHSLLVRLASGPVLLSGDLYHFHEQVPIDGVPIFNTNRADTLASMDRFRRIAQNLRAKIVIQHELGDIAKLPPFPEAAR